MNLAVPEYRKSNWGWVFGVIPFLISCLSHRSKSSDARETLAHLPQLWIPDSFPGFLVEISRVLTLPVGVYSPDCCSQQGVWRSKGWGVGLKFAGWPGWVWGGGGGVGG